MNLGERQTRRPAANRRGGDLLLPFPCPESFTRTRSWSLHQTLTLARVRAFSGMYSIVIEPLRNILVLCC